MTDLRERAAQYCSATAAWWSGAGADPMECFRPYVQARELAWRAYLAAFEAINGDPLSTLRRHLIWAEAEAMIRTGWAP